MFKTIIYLLFVTQIIFAAEDGTKPTKEDEIDITTVKSIDVEDSSIKPEYPVTEYENSYNSEVTINSKSDELTPKPIEESDKSGIDENLVEKEDKPFGTDEQPIKTNGKPFGTDEQHIKTDGKPFGTDEQHIKTNGKPFGTDEQHIKTDGKPFGTDEQHIKTDGKPFGTDEQHIKTDGKPFGTDEQHIKTDGKPFGTDEQYIKTDGKPFGTDEQHIKTDGKPFGTDEQPIKTDGKHFGTETHVDLGKEYKKVLIKTENNGKDSDKEVNFGSYDQNSVNTDFGGENKKPEDKFNGGSFDVFEKVVKLKPVDIHRKETDIGNEVTDHLIKLLKTDYRSDFDKVELGKFEPFKHGRWGSVALHSGVVRGLSNIERVGDVVVVDEYNNRKLVIATIAVKDISADYKMNAKLFHRISFKDRTLKLLLKKAVLTVKLEVDKFEKKLIVKDLTLTSTEGFAVKSGRLVWPFNKLINAIAKNQEQVIKDLIRKEFDKHMGKVIHNIEFDPILVKLF